MRRACCLALLAILSLAAHAQSYPTRPVRIVVAFSPGGSTDLLARAVGQKLGERWGQPVVVENRVGASGMIGADAVAKSAPDGYTLLMCSPQEVAVNHHVFPKVPYDPRRDLAPITLVTVTPLVIAVNP